MMEQILMVMVNFFFLYANSNNKYIAGKRMDQCVITIDNVDGNKASFDDKELILGVNLKGICFVQGILFGTLIFEQYNYLTLKMKWTLSGPSFMNGTMTLDLSSSTKIVLVVCISFC